VPWSGGVNCGVDANAGDGWWCSDANARDGGMLHARTLVISMLMLVLSECDRDWCGGGRPRGMRIGGCRCTS
jgi:hypothetical protein